MQLQNKTNQRKKNRKKSVTWGVSEKPSPFLLFFRCTVKEIMQSFNISWPPFLSSESIAPRKKVKKGIYIHNI